MTAQSRIQAELRKTDRLCDECLSELLSIKPRQTINIACRALASSKGVSRVKEDCARCRRVKTVNHLGDSARAPVVAPPPATLAAARPWYWEGSVQRRIVDFLRASGHTVHSEADTASRQQGKDIVASTPEGRLLWVTVKGYPEKSVHPQARHWFTGAFHDLSRYRSESKDAVIAMGLPAGFKTYERLVERDTAVRPILGYRVYWVHPDGGVTVDSLAE